MQEPLGGAHADPFWASQQIKHAILEAMKVIPSVYGNILKANSLLRKESNHIDLYENISELPKAIPHRIMEGLGKGVKFPLLWDEMDMSLPAIPQGEIEFSLLM